jgi:hypothetical protein
MPDKASSEPRASAFDDMKSTDFGIDIDAQIKMMLRQFYGQDFTDE